MRAPAELSVVVSTCDRPQGLARCLEAVLGGEVTPAEVIVVDQGVESAAPAVEAHRSDACFLHHIRQERRGLAASRNLGIREARFATIAVTDDDCVPDRGWLAAIETTLGAPAAPDAVSGRMLPLGPDAPDRYPQSSRTSTRRRDFAGRTLPWLVGTGANLGARRDWIERIGGYDERLGVGTAGCAGEDMDLLYRLLRAGARIRYEPDAVVYHERQTGARRAASRWSYGHGIGACCGIWLNSRELGALPVLAGWLLLRLRRLARAGVRREWPSAREELLVLAGTARGLAYGLRAGRAT